MYQALDFHLVPEPLNNRINPGDYPLFTDEKAKIQTG